MDQKIYARYEFPVEKYQNFTDIINRFHHYERIINEKGIIVSGMSCSFRHGKPSAAILLVYDSQTDTQLALECYGIKNLKVDRYIKD